MATSKRNLVQHNGIHIDDMDIIHLVQGSQVQNAVGLGTKSIVFQVTDPKNKSCCHHIDLSAPEPDAKLYKKLVNDPLFKFMCPTPETQNIAYFQCEDAPIIVSKLSQLVSPTMVTTYPVWDINNNTIDRLRINSNIVTVAITGADLNDTPRIKRKMEAFSMSPAKLLIEYKNNSIPTGSIKLIKSKLKVKDFDRIDIDVQLKRCGAKFLREFMRK